MRLLVICPHFAPDTAPTGTVMTRIVTELAERDHEIHVVTSLPWYREHRIEPGWAGRWRRTETTGWGTITRIHPFPGDDKANLARRALGFAGFSALALVTACSAGRRDAGGRRRRIDAVLAMSPPLTLGPTGRAVGILRSAPLLFNIQDVFPDAAITTGSITDPRVIRAARWLERWSYRVASAVTVLSDDLAANVSAKAGDRTAVHVIPNFVDTSAITPADRMTPYRAALGIGDAPVVLYAGNLGFSQSLDLLVEAARRMPDVHVVINGDGVARDRVAAAADELPNFHVVGYQPASRLAEVLASGDVHAVVLKTGLGDVSVPSKTYSSLAAARPVVAAIDPDTAVPRLLAEAGAGISVEPDDPDSFVAALRSLVDDPGRRATLGSNGRRWAVEYASPEAVGIAYESLLRAMAARDDRPARCGSRRGPGRWGRR